MTAPAGLLAAALLLWGWFCASLFVAVPLAVAFEAWRRLGVRWNLSPRDVQRVADFCTWAFLLEAGYFIVDKGWPLPILAIVEWLPVVLAPLVLAQLYSSAGRIELSALFLSLRAADSGELARRSVDLSFAYAAVCMLAAGAANVRNQGYFIAASVLALWSLWAVRSRRFPFALWALAIGFAVAIGYAGHHGLNRMQAWVFNVAIEYLQLDLTRVDPYRASTDIGHIGELKSSDRIVLRVEVEGEAPTALLLHRASYDLYASATWIAKDAAFSALAPDAASGNWLIDGASQPRFNVRVSEYFPSGVGVLALPVAVATVSIAANASPQRNRLGAVRVERNPGFASYLAAGGGAAAHDPLSANDLRVPAQDAQTLQRIVAELSLATLAPAEAVAVLKRYFSEHFRYTTYRAERVQTPHAIAEFLMHSRAGHCEYFATATVLLARAAGIPARYATGYSVQERSAFERRYVVRERHAHAWARLYVDGAWRDVDTTPPLWFEAEARDASFWQPLTDFGSWLGWRFSQWRARPAAATSPWWYGALALLSALLVCRLWRGGGFSRVRTGSPTRALSDPGEGFAPEFQAIERRLAETGLPRLAIEAQGEWVRRIAPSLDEGSRSALHELLRLHYRSRFDPLALSAAERRDFALAVRDWLAQNPSPTLQAATAQTLHS